METVAPEIPFPVLALTTVPVILPVLPGVGVGIKIGVGEGVGVGVVNVASISPRSKPLTCTGIFLLVVVPSPNCP